MDDKFILLAADAYMEEIRLLDGPNSLVNLEEKAQEITDEDEEFQGFLLIVPVTQFWNVNELREEKDEKEGEDEDE